ncbi:MAG: DUF4956 domain-containing protein [Clostridiales bacterium]|nr:DUF4956 domain-containing protein [Clostridiales bacterium]MDY4171694.1 DUF4956 domain-containing protein [Evtepia sp.]
MKQTIFQLLKEQGDLTFEQIFTRVGMTALLALVIFASYTLSHRGAIYSRKFNVSLVILAVLTGTVMIVIGNNIALSLGMVGALSIVRFRTAIKDSRDTMYLFWSIIVGICCGVGSFFVAAVGSGAVFLVLLFFGTVRNDSRVLVIIRGARRSELKVEALVFQAFERRARLRVKNTTPETVELIYETSEALLTRARKKNPALTDTFYAIDEIEYVNFVMQNDEIAN